MKKKNIDLFEARTKEWDASSYQGRTKDQVENNYKVIGLTIVSVIVVALFLTVVAITPASPPKKAIKISNT